MKQESPIPSLIGFSHIREEAVKARKVEAALAGQKWCERGTHGVDKVAVLNMAHGAESWCKECFGEYLESGGRTWTKNS
jgi:hypothetical protein